MVGLTDAATIAVDASLGNDFRVTIAGNRTMANPANPADGQKITFQVTQGSGGSFTLTWGSSYEFSTGLPLPTLSTAAGETDLLCFIYNGTKAKWLLAAFVAGFSTPVVTGPPPGTYRLFPSTNGPASPVSYSGPFVCGVVVGVTTGGCWLDGYWWWVCPTGQSTSPQKFALWCLYNSNSGSLVANSTVTSGALTAGQWNYVKLGTPLPLALGATYVAATGFSGSFPDTNSQFGSGEPYSAGIVKGPLTAYSDASGSNPSPFKTAQAVFSVASSDPTAFAPVYGSSSCNFWMDLLVDTNPPANRARPTGCGRATRRSRATWTRTPRATPWPPSSSCRSPARWTTSGSTPHPARACCPLDARSGASARRAWWRAPITRRRPGRGRPGPAGWRARTAASPSLPGTTRWQCSTVAGRSGTRRRPVTGAAGDRR